ncbi:hypothetical protein F2Q69_00025905 [Brassica cretica]|uniref:Uncharacterized protein n=1 Tax=Brassica cretica TaxID=69181 RepID=A0A8S9RTV7_BRACR|nr:hypothetical protein F2Q69_00025905 [Brassica cretica]
MVVMASAMMVFTVVVTMVVVTEEEEVTVIDMEETMAFCSSRYCGGGRRCGKRNKNCRRWRRRIDVVKKRIVGVSTITPSWSVKFRSKDVAVKTIDEAETMYGGDGRRAVVVGNRGSW